MPVDSPLIVIAGATATGKTALALELARAFDGEIVNADSRSFYRGMDIGTAKPSVPERVQTRHHLVDILDPDEPMSIATFQELAFAAIDDVGQRGRVPFLTGGSAQYLNAVVQNWSIPRVPPNTALREALEQRLHNEGLEALVQELRAVDPESAERTASNPRRVIRALEVYRVTGLPMSAQLGQNPPRYRALQFVLQVPREVLHQRVATRITEWLDAGFVEEVRQLLATGYEAELPSFSSIGYREIAKYLDGSLSLDDAIAQIRIGTHRLIRHQETWFRKNPELIPVQLPVDAERVRTLVTAHLTGSGCLPHILDT